MLQKRVTVGPLAALNANLFFAAATPANANPLVLLTTVLDAPRRISVAYGNEAAPRTLKLAGTDRYGQAQGETLAIPAGGAGSPIQSALDYLTLTSVTPSGAFTANITVGTNGNASSEPVALDTWVSSAFNVQLDIPVAGGDFTVQYSNDDPNAYAGMNAPTPITPAGMTWFNDATLANVAASNRAFVRDLPLYVRLLQTGGAGVAGCQATMLLTQGGAPLPNLMPYGGGP